MFSCKCCRRISIAVLLVTLPGGIQSQTKGADSKVQWTRVDGTRLPVPPAEHPRLHLRGEHVADLPVRLRHPPKAEASEDLFLTALQVTDSQSGVHRPVERLEAGERTGCMLRGPQATWVVLLRKDSQRSGQEVRFTVSGNSSCRFLVTDLEPGTWRAVRAGEQETRMVMVATESGAAWFEGTAGTWTVSNTPK